MKKTSNALVIVSFAVLVILFLMMFIVPHLLPPAEDKNYTITANYSVIIDGESVEPAEINYTSWIVGDRYDEPPSIVLVKCSGDSSFTIQGFGGSTQTHFIYFIFEDKLGVTLDYLVTESFRGAEMDIAVEIEDGEASMKIIYTEEHSGETKIAEETFERGERIHVSFGSFD
jgi:hypothetical protein